MCAASNTGPKGRGKLTNSKYQGLRRGDDNVRAKQGTYKAQDTQVTWTR